MAISFVKYGETLKAAWKDVLDEKTSTNWALFTYEGQTNDLKLVGKGSGGIEEMIEDLNSGKIMYAFVEVKDPKTSLPKFVLINWQGEGSNTLRKGICANHIRDVEKFFKGAHISINARNEDEVEPKLIIDKVARSTGSVYNFKPRVEPIESTGPVGSNYQRVNPVQEINSKERDQFWQQAEQEEKKRKEEEKKRLEEERRKREEELKEQERKYATEQETKNIQNEKVATPAAKPHNKVIIEHSNGSSEKHEETENTINQAELLKQQRNQEAQELISQRTVNAKLIFEQNSVASKKWAPEKPIRASLTKNLKKVEQIETKPVDESTTDEEVDQFSTIKRSPKDLEKKSSDQNLLYETSILQKEFEIPEMKKEEVHIEQITEQQLVDEVVYQEFEDGPGIQARALYDYQAADDTEISFDPGDIITNIDQVDEGWWQGLGPDGTYGLFPANYVELI